MEISKQQYEYSLNRIEELLPLVTDETPADDRNAVELAIVSDVVEEYEKLHYHYRETYYRRTYKPLNRREGNDPKAACTGTWDKSIAGQRLHLRASRTDFAYSSRHMHCAWNCSGGYVGVVRGQ